MHDFLRGNDRGFAQGTCRNLARRGLAIAFTALIFSGLGCGGSGSSTAVDLTVTVESGLQIDTVDIAIRAPGKPDKHLTQMPKSDIVLAIFTEGLAGGTVVSLEVSGIKAGATVVLARAQAALIAGHHVPVTVHLTAACAGVLSCSANQTCENGACVAIPTMSNDAGTSGSGGGGGGTGGTTVDGSQPDIAGSGGAGTGGAGQTGGMSGNGGGGAAVLPDCLAGSMRLCKDDPDLKALGNCGGGTEPCTAGRWGTCTIQPAAKDACNVLGDDASCNGKPNEGCPCVDGETQACGPSADTGICRRGRQTCAGGTWGACVGAVYATARDCASTGDNDCNGAPDNMDSACACPAGTSGAVCPGNNTGGCKSGTRNCTLSPDKSSTSWGPCAGVVLPASSDTCDAGNDATCNGTANEGCECINGSPPKSCTCGTQTCSGGKLGACVTNCGTGMCIGSSCCAAPVTCYQDQDGDGFGNPQLSAKACGSCPSGTTTNNTDCFDVAGSGASVYPGQTAYFAEPYNLTSSGFDYDCSGQPEFEFNGFVVSGRCMGSCPAGCFTIGGGTADVSYLGCGGIYTKNVGCGGGNGAICSDVPRPCPDGTGTCFNQGCDLVTQTKVRCH